MAVDLSILEHHERQYRDRLLTDPSNPDARLDLAWCLFLRAVCAVVREDGPKYGGDSVVPQARQAEVRRHEEARVLLLDGLREAIKVCRLSVDPVHHVDAARLEFLIGLIGEQSIIAMAQGQVDASLKRLVSDLNSDKARGELLREAPVRMAFSAGRASEGVSRRSSRRTANPPRTSGQNG